LAGELPPVLFVLVVIPQFNVSVLSELSKPRIEKDVTPTGERTARAECPNCGTSFEFPYLLLYLLEGAPSAGKSTTAGYLHDALELTIYEEVCTSPDYRKS
jgi:hypothetical protein